MPFADVGRVHLCYEVSGPEDGEPFLLIHGLGAQLIAWYPGFCRALEAAGFRVIRFDNRDVGKSCLVWTASKTRGSTISQPRSTTAATVQRDSVDRRKPCCRRQTAVRGLLSSPCPQQ